MINFIKKNSVPTTILVISIVLVLITWLKGEPKPIYTLAPEDVLANLENAQHVTKADAFDMQHDTDNYVFIDLRNAQEFNNGHIQNALNIPVARLLSKENIEFLNGLKSSNKMVILYGQTEGDAISPWILLQQMDIGNTSVLYGGYECFNENKPDCPTGYPNYDFAAIASQGGEKTIEIRKEKPVVKKKKQIPVQKKVKLEAEGGC